MRARVAVSLVFGYFGVVVGTWTSRLPTLKNRLGLTDTQLGTALVCFAAGSVLGMLLLARVIDALGPARALGTLALTQAIALVLAAMAPNLPALCCVLAFFGAVQGTLNVTMNSAAVDVQRAYHRRMMSSFHALFSVGGLAGAASGGLAAGAGISVRHHFLAVLCVAAVPAVLAHAWRLPGGPGTADVDVDADIDVDADVDADVRSARAHVTARGTSLRLATVLLGLFAMFAMVAEGAVGDWSSVYLHENLGAGVAFASSAFVVFSIAMFISRVAGDRVVTSLGTRRFLQYSAVLGAVSLGAGVLSTAPWLAVAGFAGLGLGLAGLTPQIYTIAGDVAHGSAGRALSLIVGMGYIGFLVGPALIGFVSGATSLRVALLLPSLLILIIPALVPALRLSD
ncbi:MFS transporter [Streptomyces sp. NBC_00669]|uniref:MFS transporter n=1 Tax=Streptomyces sp. NBC_00669 TaxID=2976011 RepID=UPI002E2EF908|nr:MFS transporter [Streptomyces sp. NBC_00669]